MDEDERPVLTAVSSSARQLFLLLRCITFSSKAHVTISEEGLKFSVSEGSSMEASTFLAKSLFTTYNFHSPNPARAEISDSEDEAETEPPTSPNFQISLPALLETLQIFGLTDPSVSKPPWARDNPYPTSTAFSNNVLGMNNLCRLSYLREGSPLSIILTEASVRTTCDLSTYEPEYHDEIPFDRRSVVLKTIMRGSWIHDALSELSSTTPDNLTMYAKTIRGQPFFALSATGTLGSARVEFNNNNNNKDIRRMLAPNNNNDDPQPNLLETFQLSNPNHTIKSTYKFSMVHKAARAMSLAKKVSIRLDAQGVLSLQFMIELEPSGAAAGAGGVEMLSFVDFVLVPLVEEEEGEGEEGADGGDVDETFLMDGGYGEGGGDEDEDENML